MAYILYGFIGAVLATALMGSAFFAGWQAHKHVFGAVAKSPSRYARPADAPAEATQSEAEREQVRRYREELEAEQDAFRRMLGYNMNTALGLENEPGVGEGKE